jgi:hypothetical protein
LAFRAALALLALPLFLAFAGCQGSSSGPEIEPWPNLNDQIPLNQVTWRHGDVSMWAQTSTVTSATVGNNTVCVNHTHARIWPYCDDREGGKMGVSANPWVFAKFNGRWYAATYEFLRPGVTCKDIENWPAGWGKQTSSGPFNDGWIPQPGEQVGLMASTCLRGGAFGPAYERSNVVLITLGDGNGDGVVDYSY